MDRVNEQTKGERNRNKIWQKFVITTFWKAEAIWIFAFCMFSEFTPFNRRKIQFYGSFIFFRILCGMQNVCTLKNDNNHFMVNKLRCIKNCSIVNNRWSFIKFISELTKWEKSKKLLEQKNGLFHKWLPLLFLLVSDLHCCQCQLPATLLLISSSNFSFLFHEN